MPKVSVVVPVFGVEKYIERCARSLFEQTLDDIEFIFVNDCTQDNSMEVLETVINDYPSLNIVIINHEINKGLPQARKSGISVATGDYIVNCDSDDWVDPKYCQSMYETAKRDGADMVVCGYYTTDGIEIQETKWADNSIYAKSDLAMKYAVAMLVTPNVWIKMVKREILQRPDFIFPQKYLAEDWVFSVQCTYYSRKVSYIDSPLYYYYTGNYSQSRAISVEACIKNCLQERDNIRLISRWLSNRGMRREFRDEIIRRKVRTKEYLLPAFRSKKCRLLWYFVFPEVNLHIFSNPYVSEDYKRDYRRRLMGKII